MSTETPDIVVDKTLQNLEALCKSIDGKMEAGDGLDLYMIASRSPRGILVETSPRVIDEVVAGLDPHTVMADLNRLTVLIPFATGVNLAVPVGEIPHLVANLNMAFHNALFNASKTVKADPEK